MFDLRLTAFAALLLAGCAQPSAEAVPAADAAATATSTFSVTSSTPPAGATVSGPVNAVMLHFSRPARLLELTLTAPDGSVMPSMVTAVGEQQHYEVPVSADQKGAYRVDWRASVAGQAQSGSFGFTVR